MTNHRGRREIVRVEVELDLESDDVVRLVSMGVPVFSPAPIYVVFPPGMVKWPPLAAIGVFMGEQGREQMKADGAKIYVWGDRQALRLERKLLGIHDGTHAVGDT